MDPREAAAEGCAIRADDRIQINWPSVKQVRLIWRQREVGPSEDHPVHRKAKRDFCRVRQLRQIVLGRRQRVHQQQMYNRPQAPTAVILLELATNRSIYAESSPVAGIKLAKINGVTEC